MSTTLKARKRDKTGSRDARALRSQGRIPANLQGGGGEHVDISVDAREFHTRRRLHEHLYDLDVDGTPETAIVRELTWDTFGQEVLHVEFRRVRRGEKVRSEVGLRLVGQPKGGIGTLIAATLEIVSVPSRIPDDIEVDVDGLEEGTALTAGDLKLPEGVDLAGPPDQPIAHVETPRAFVEAAPEPAEGEAVEGAEGGGEAPPAGAGEESKAD